MSMGFAAVGVSVTASAIASSIVAQFGLLPPADAKTNSVLSGANAPPADGVCHVARIAEVAVNTCPAVGFAAAYALMVFPPLLENNDLAVTLLVDDVTTLVVNVCESDVPTKPPDGAALEASMALVP
jgi:hypothetical protein